MKLHTSLKYFIHVLILPVKGHPPKIGIMQAMCDVQRAIFPHKHPEAPPKENDDKGQHALSVSHSQGVVSTLLHD